MCKQIDIKTTIIPVKQNDKLSELTKTTIIALLANIFINKVLPGLYNKQTLFYSSMYISLLFVVSRELQSSKGCIGIFFGAALSSSVINGVDGKIGLVITIVLSTVGFGVGYIADKINLGEFAKSAHELCMEFNNCMDTSKDD